MVVGTDREKGRMQPDPMPLASAPTNTSRNLRQKSFAPRRVTLKIRRNSEDRPRLRQQARMRGAKGHKMICNCSILRHELFKARSNYIEERKNWGGGDVKVLRRPKIKAVSTPAACCFTLDSLCPCSHRTYNPSTVCRVASFHLQRLQSKSQINGKI